MNLVDIISEKEYANLAKSDWPLFSDILQGKGSTKPEIQKHIDTIIADKYKSYQLLNKGSQIADGNRQTQGQIFFDKKVNNILSHCRVPWETMGINSYGDVFICESPAWLPKFVGNIHTVDSIYDILNSETAKSIRQEILAGRYYYCNNKLCMFFGSMKPIEATPDVNSFPLESVTSPDTVISQIPKNLIFDFDHTCNFKCPSCRSDLINNNKNLYIRKINNAIVEKIKHLIINKIDDQPVEIRWAGGELFISQPYIELIDYITSLNKKNIRHIIQTNGSYLKAKSDLVEQLLPFTKELRISFDAATPDTYGRVRVNGQWDTLVDNARWVVSLVKEKKLPVKITADFVVQLDNYKEIVPFWNLCLDIGITHVNFQKMWNWNTWSTDEFNRLNVYNPTHPEYNQVIKFLRQVNAV